jgi:hypothetical protein
VTPSLSNLHLIGPHSRIWDTTLKQVSLNLTLQVRPTLRSGDHTITSQKPITNASLRLDLVNLAPVEISKKVHLNDGNPVGWQLCWSAINQLCIDNELFRNELRQHQSAGITLDSKPSTLGIKWFIELQKGRLMQKLCKESDNLPTQSRFLTVLNANSTDG